MPRYCQRWGFKSYAHCFSFAEVIFWSQASGFLAALTTQGFLNAFDSWRPICAVWTLLATSGLIFLLFTVPELRFPPRRLKAVTLEDLWVPSLGRWRHEKKRSLQIKKWHCNWVDTEVMWQRKPHICSQQEDWRTQTNAEGNRLIANLLRWRT